MAITDNIVAYYKLDESSGNASDSTAGANTLTNNGTVTYSTGKLSNAAYFDGSSTMYFSRSNDADFYGLQTSTDMSISCWAYFTTGSPSSGVFYAMFSQEDSTGSGTPAWNIGYGNEGGTIRFQMVNSSGTSQQTAARINQTLSSATWYHIVFLYTRSSGSNEIYLNNSSIGTATNNTTVKQGDGNFQVGKSPNGFGNTMNGRMDEIGVWNRILTSGEISTIYNSGTGLTYPFTVNTYSFPALEAGHFA